MANRRTESKDHQIISEASGVGVATADDVDLAATLPATAGEIERKPVSMKTLNLLKRSLLLDALVRYRDDIKKWSGNIDVDEMVADIQMAVQLSLAHPRLAISYGRARAARVAINRKLEKYAKVLGGAAKLYDPKSDLGQQLAPFAVDRSAARGRKKAAATKNKNKQTKSGASSTASSSK